MRAVLQRVSGASVKIDGATVGECGKGLMILLGVADGDTEKEADMLCEKIIKLRIFSDENGKMNLSIKDIGGQMLIVCKLQMRQPPRFSCIRKA